MSIDDKSIAAEHPPEGWLEAEPAPRSASENILTIANIFTVENILAVGDTRSVEQSSEGAAK